MDQYDKKRITMAIVTGVLGLISIIISLSTLGSENNIPRIFSITFGAFALILNADEKRNGNGNPLLLIGTITGAISLAISIIGIMNYWH